MVVLAAAVIYIYICGCLWQLYNYNVLFDAGCMRLWWLNLVVGSSKPFSSVTSKTSDSYIYACIQCWPATVQNTHKRGGGFNPPLGVASPCLWGKIAWFVCSLSYPKALHEIPLSVQGSWRTTWKVSSSGRGHPFYSSLGLYFSRFVVNYSFTDTLRLLAY